MGCTGCSTGGDGAPRGCGDKGHCTSGSCNKMNTYDWLSNVDLHDPSEYQYMEVSFKKGARKDFYKRNNQIDAITGDMVVVESSSGYDVGRVSLSGELVRLQMKKKRVNEDRVIHKVLRRANERDLEKLEEARSKEQKTMVRARVIARMLGLNMKIGDVEYQGDNRKATFYYTADGRVDFRELVRSFANEFRIKIEMRQIGSRQESGRIGGFGPCGRELCCSTWLSNFKSVSTSAARYQNLAINQTKLSGQCGRLKCCLNFELDSYIDALADFPEKADRIRTKEAKYQLIKTDIFKGIMYYVQLLERGRGAVVALRKERVAEILEQNKRGEQPDDLGDAVYANISQEADDHDFGDVTGHIELPVLPKRKKGRSNKNNSKDRRRRGRSGGGDNKRGPKGGNNSSRSDQKPRGEKKEGGENKNKPKRNNRNRNRPPRNNRNDNKNNSNNNNNDNKKS